MNKTTRDISTQIKKNKKGRHNPVDKKEYGRYSGDTVWINNYRLLQDNHRVEIHFDERGRKGGMIHTVIRENCEYRYFLHVK